jgi:hypothetical protein
MEDLQEDLADAKDQSSLPTVTLIPGHPDLIGEIEPPKYLTSLIGLLPGEIAALDGAAYAIATRRVFR